MSDQAKQQSPAKAPGPVIDLDLNNIQGDILSGFPKKTETNYFFGIDNPDLFKQQLKNFIPLVKTVAQVLKDRKKIDDHKNAPHLPGGKPHLIKLAGVNVGFSHAGLAKLGIVDTNLLDTAFLGGQAADAEGLGDPGSGTGPTFVPDWDAAFKGNQIHGSFLVAGDSHPTVDSKIREIEKIFGVNTPKSSICHILSISGDVRPGVESGHEHFGFLDGISNPLVIGFDQKIPPGPAPVHPGIVLLGRDGDNDSTGKPNVRDDWMVDGSFLVFRYLHQKVPEFNKFLSDNSLQLPGLSKKEGADLLGARLVGRWQSGAPVDLAPFEDDPDLVDHPDKVNSFEFTAERDFQKICPFAAHVRKTNPRADLEANGISIETKRILRRGIQFGPEVSKQEQREQRTIFARGLLFQCYQSSIVNGFQFIQKSWANNVNFPPFQKTPQVPGFDPIIGQGANRKLSGYDPNDPSKELALPADPWVVPRGGEYFFVPSIKGLNEKFVATH
ncbi:peroxidase TAP [Pluteus cervinus]|uniref:Peroxidase TAP n=1 Tax=Pluteus cervinus TaxID=181527 RepID=A0ACD3B223_9AGAR|nr:peroxidase TAP [Pluteus cervinus]